MADFLRIDFDSTRLEQALDRIGAAANAAVRPAAQAGAQVLYEEVLQRAPESTKPHWFQGKNKSKKYLFMPGTLRRSIYQAFSEDRSSDTRATYHIAWNHKKAPYGFMVEGGTKNSSIANMVEFGTSRSAARPFLRPAWDAANERAISAASAEFTSRLKEVL